VLLFCQVFGQKNAVTELGVLDSLVAKRNAIQLAVDAAVTILRVDQVQGERK
jgi:chaperonin GroEL (HSP60 family)